MIIKIIRMTAAKFEGWIFGPSSSDETVDCISVHSMLHNLIVMSPKSKPSVLKSFKSRGNISLTMLLI